MASTPAPFTPVQSKPVTVTEQLITLYDSLPSLIGQARIGRLAATTVVQLRMIISKHRKQAGDYLMAKGLPDPFINLPDTVNPAIPLPADWPGHKQIEASRAQQAQQARQRAAAAAAAGTAAGESANAQPRPPLPNPQASQAAVQAATTRRPPAGNTAPGPGTPQTVRPPRPPGQAPPPQTPNARPRPTPRPGPQTQGQGQNQVRPAAPPNPAPPATGQTNLKPNSAGSTPAPSRTSSEAPGQPGQKPPTMAPGGKFTWHQVFQMSEPERQAYFEENPDAKPAWTKIWNHAAQKKPNNLGGNGSAPGSASGSASPAALPVGPSVSASHNQNVAAADILAKNPPPMPNLNLPPTRAAPAPSPAEKPRPQAKQVGPKQAGQTPQSNPGSSQNQQGSGPAPASKPQPAQRPVSQGQNISNANSNAGPNSNVANPYTFLHAIRPAPPHLDPTTLTKVVVDFHVGLSEEQASVMSQENKDTRNWIRYHMGKRAEEQRRLQQQAQQQQNQAQQQRQAQQKGGQVQQQQQPGQGSSFKQPAPPQAQQPPQPTRVTLQNLPLEIQKYKEAHGKNMSIEAVRDLCNRTNTPWTADLERAVEACCYVKPAKSSQQILSEQVRELAMDVTGSVVNDGMQKLLAGLAEDLYGDNLRGACLAGRARSKDEVGLTPKDMSFHLRHKQDLVTAGYGQEVVTAGIKRKGLLGYKSDAIKRLKATHEAKSLNS